MRPGSALDSVELTLAHPLGLTEIAEGIVETTAEGATMIELTSLDIGHTSTGKDVTGMARRYRVQADGLTYEIDMQTGATPMTRHLIGELRRLSN